MRILSRLILFFAFGISSVAPAEPGSQVITFGITPQHSPGELAKLWGPICEYLSKRTGYQVQFKTSKDLGEFWKNTNEGLFDMIYINPPRYTSAQAAAGYRAFAKDSDSPLVGIIVVRKDGLTRIEELNGKKLAVPSLVALGAAQVPQAYLRGKGIRISPVAVNSHDSVYLTVEKGLYPAGASNLRIFGALDPATQAKFRILWKSEPMPPFAFAAHPRVSPKAVEGIRRALLEMDSHPESRALLAVLNVKGIVAAKDSDYDSVRKLNLRLE